MRINIIYTIIIFLYIIPSYCSLDYISLYRGKKDTEITDPQYVVSYIGLNTDSYFSITRFQSIGISTWLKIIANSNQIILAWTYDNNINIQIILSPNGYLQFLDLAIQSDIGCWEYIYAQIDYSSGTSYLNYIGINNFQSTTKSKSANIINPFPKIQDIYVGGDASTFCSCSLNLVYLIPNNSITSTSQIFSLAGGDIDYYLWYIFNDPLQVTDISGNPHTITSDNNPAIYSSGQISNLNDIEGYYKIDSMNYFSIPNVNSIWTTASIPSLTMSFHFKINPQITENQIPIFNRGGNIFVVTLNLQSTSIDFISVIVGGDAQKITFETPYSIKDNIWHHCLVQIIWISERLPVYQYARIDNLESEWFARDGIVKNSDNKITHYFFNLVFYLGDSNDDSIWIGYGASSNELFYWEIKNFIMYSGTFKSNTLQNCNVGFDSTMIWEYNRDDLPSSKSVCLDCLADYCMNIDSTNKSTSCTQLSSLPECPIGSYLMNSNFLLCDNRCIPCTYPIAKSTCCHSTCKSCSGISDTNCLSCNPSSSNPYLFMNSCLTNCPAQYYADNNNECQSCSVECATCLVSSTICTSCFNGLYLDTQTQTCKKFTQGHLDVSEYDTLDVYLTFDSILYSANIPNLDKLLTLQISDLATNDFRYTINQVSNTNITFRLNPIQTIDHNILSLAISDTSLILDSNNNPILSSINNVTLRFYIPVNQMGLNIKAMLIIGASVIVASSPMIVSEGLSTLWGLIDVLQYIFYFIYLNMDIPIEFKKFLIFFKIATLPLPNIPVIFFGKLHEVWNITLPELQAPQNFDDFGIDALFIRTGLTYIIFIISTFAFVAIIIYIEKLIYKLTKSNRMKMIIKMIKWNLPIRYILLNIIQLSFAIFLQFTNLSNNTGFYLASIIFTVISALFILLFIIWAFRQTNTKLFIYRRLTFNNQYGALTGEFVKTRISKVSFVIRNFGIIQVIQKIIYIFGFVILHNYVIINLISIMIQNIIMIILLIKYSPYIRKSVNIKNIIQEMIFILIALLLLIINQSEIPINMLQILGYSLIVLSCICFSYDLVFIGIDWIKSVKNIIIEIKKYYEKIPNKHSKRLSENISKYPQAIFSSANNVSHIIDESNASLSTLKNNNTSS